MRLQSKKPMEGEGGQKKYEAGHQFGNKESNSIEKERKWPRRWREKGKPSSGTRSKQGHGRGREEDVAVFLVPIKKQSEDRL